MARLTAQFWIDAYRARLEVQGIAVFIAMRGDGHAGAILVKQSTLDGKATLFQRVPDLDTGAPRWQVLAQGSEFDVDATAVRQRGFDPDLWLIEVEDRAGRHFLDEIG